MTDPTEIARVAAGLTRAQREAVLDEIFSLRTGVHRVRKQLVGKGLMKQRDGSYFTTPDGEAVRDHILREKSGG